MKIKRKWGGGGGRLRVDGCKRRIEVFGGGGGVGVVLGWVVRVDVNKESKFL